MTLRNTQLFKYVRCIALTPLIALAVSTAFAQNKSVNKDHYQMKIMKERWDASDEADFSKLVERIGKAVALGECKTFQTCMANVTVNPFHSEKPLSKYYADCADFPYYLRTYFAWQKGLPFSYSDSVKASAYSAGAKDLRYSAYGNVVASRRSLLPENGESIDIRPHLQGRIRDFTSTANFRTGLELQMIDDGTSTANFRMGPELKKRDEDKKPLLVLPKDSHFSDFYPVDISRSSIQPGTVIYDANGHVALVYQVTDDGQVLYVDAHPDNSLTVGKYGPTISRSGPYVGSGFKKFRPQFVKDPKFSKSGVLVEGTIDAIRDSKIVDFSTKQFLGDPPNPALLKTLTGWKQAIYIYNENNLQTVQVLKFHDYVRRSLMKKDLKLDPVAEFKKEVKDVCRASQDRVETVEAAINSGVDKLEHPSTLPANIYSTDGAWENFSSPSRDIRLKGAFLQLKLTAQLLKSKVDTKDQLYQFSGSDIVQDLVETYSTEAENCKIKYINSDKQVVTINLNQLQERLHLLSFDPYHCVERRWGAQGAELKSCVEDETKRLWYVRTQQLRNHVERKADVVYNYTLEQYKTTIPGLGEDTIQFFDVANHIKTFGRVVGK